MFVKDLNVNQEYVDKLKKYVIDQWNNRVAKSGEDENVINSKIQELKTSAIAAAEKIKFLTSEIAIKYMEADLVKAENEIQQLEQEKANKKTTGNTIDMGIVMEHIGYFLEHLEELLIDGANPLKRAAFFGLIFDEMPTYQDLVSGTPKLAPYLALKHHFATSSVADGDPTENISKLII